MELFLICLFSVLPAPGTPTARVDYAELNHFYDNEGRLVFDQLIFYDWNGGGLEVRDWRLVKEEWQWPVSDLKHGGYYAHLPDTTITASGIKSTPVNGVVIRFNSFQETWTQYDPELVEREKLPKEQRKPLIFK